MLELFHVGNVFMFHIIYIAALTKNLNDPKIVCPCFSYYYLFENFWFML